MHATCMLAHYRLSLLSDTGEIGFHSSMAREGAHIYSGLMGKCSE